MKENGFNATFFIVANLNSDPNNLYRDTINKEQVKELSNSGFEIGSHTIGHPILIDLTEKEIEFELEESKRLLEETYSIKINSVAFPYGKYDEDVLNIAQRYYMNARAIYNLNPKSFFIDSLGLQKDTNAQSVCEYIHYAKEKKLWLVLVFHDIIDAPNLWDTSVTDFRKILECAQNEKIKVDSINSCKNKYY